MLGWLLAIRAIQNGDYQYFVSVAEILGAWKSYSVRESARPPTAPECGLWRYTDSVVSVRVTYPHRGVNHANDYG